MIRVELNSNREPSYLISLKSMIIDGWILDLVFINSIYWLPSKINLILLFSEDHLLLTTNEANVDFVTRLIYTRKLDNDCTISKPIVDPYTETVT